MKYYMKIDTEGLRGIMFPGESFRITEIHTDMPDELKEKLVPELKLSKEGILEYDNTTGIATVVDWNWKISIDNIKSLTRYQDIIFCLNNVDTYDIDLTLGSQIIYGVDEKDITFVNNMARIDIPEEEAGTVMQQAIKDCEITDDLSDYQKIYRCYRWVVENITYDYSYHIGSSYWEQVINLKEGVCESYTALFSGFLKRLNFVTRNNYSIEGHVYNDVWYNGNWYEVDTTWERFHLPEEEPTDTPTESESEEKSSTESKTTESESSEQEESESSSELSEPESESSSQTEESEPASTISGNDAIIEESEEQTE